MINPLETAHMKHIQFKYKLFNTNVKFTKYMRIIQNKCLKFVTVSIELL